MNLPRRTSSPWRSVRLAGR